MTGGKVEEKFEVVEKTWTKKNEDEWDDDRYYHENVDKSEYNVVLYKNNKGDIVKVEVKQYEYECEKMYDELNENYEDYYCREFKNILTFDLYSFKKYVRIIDYTYLLEQEDEYDNDEGSEKTVVILFNDRKLIEDFVKNVVDRFNQIKDKTLEVKDLCTYIVDFCDKIYNEFIE